MNLIFVNSHPIQYFSPLYQEITKDSSIRLKVLYLSDETVHGYRDKQFGVNVKWDLPLLEGYNFSFIRNHSWRPSLKNGFFGLINFGLLDEIRQAPKQSVIIVHGWAYFSNVIALIAAAAFGHTVCLRGETPFKQENQKSFLRKAFRNALLKVAIFPFVDRFLFIGEQNRLFYKKMGVKDKKLLFTPYSVDNERFRHEFNNRVLFRKHAREKFDITENQLVILYSGKYIEKKRPMDLLVAFQQLPIDRFFLVMMGEGELRREMEEFISTHDLSSKVLLTGFVNQSEVSSYYSIADIFVMCSGGGETWGLSVNEAMNFNLPLVVSDITGCSDDLVKPEVNGYVFKTGDISDFKEKLNQFTSMDNCARVAMGKVSATIVSNYSYKNVIDGIKQIII